MNRRETLNSLKILKTNVVKIIHINNFIKEDQKQKNGR